jgi:hypothetical protein
LVDSRRALSAVAAEEAATMAGEKKQVTMIVPEASWETAAAVTRDFETALKKRGFFVIAKTVNVGDPMKGDFGLKAADFFDLLEKSPDAGAIVSLVGAPLLKPGEFQRVSATHPPILVVATVQLVPGDRMQLARLLDAKIIQAAIIDGADPNAKPTDKADAAHKLFARNFRIQR